jgi:hypothetical protein
MSVSGRPYISPLRRPLPPGASPDGTGESMWHHENNLRSNAGTPGRASAVGDVIVRAAVCCVMPPILWPAIWLGGWR